MVGAAVVRVVRMARAWGKGGLEEYDLSKWGGGVCPPLAELAVHWERTDGDC
ncbi:protein of unknown function [Kyrpidia spormannii]|uniref:Uncharacterized protein n=2 Tax=Kyrpidia spormannii TaxID=2055160 RepID=A0ACA8Z511_9BACL|nr:protein of unknown function [Kyrpidia spormannii]CAB3390306.1 protein of unknown function [Kyrpidia spormannii]